MSEHYEEIIVNQNTNVLQSNYLIENKPKMTTDELKMFLTLVSTLNRDDTDLKNIKLKVTDIIKLWGVHQKNAYKKVKQALNGLMSKHFELEVIRPDGTRLTQRTTYVNTYSYGEGDGYATVKIDPMFKPYLIDLKEQFTLYGLRYGLNLESSVSIRTYELLVQYETLQSRSFTVEDYKKKVGIENKYKGSNTNLKKYVLDKVVKEITEKTNLLVRYEIKGRGEKAIIEFAILKKDRIYPGISSYNSSFAQEEKQTLYDLAVDMLKIDVDFNPKQIKEAVEIVTIDLDDEREVVDRLDVIKEAYDNYLEQCSKREIKNKWAYFKKILTSKVS